MCQIPGVSPWWASARVLLSDDESSFLSAPLDAHARAYACYCSPTYVYMRMLVIALLRMYTCICLLLQSYVCIHASRHTLHTGCISCLERLVLAYFFVFNAPISLQSVCVCVFTVNLGINVMHLTRVLESYICCVKVRG